MRYYKEANMYIVSACLVGDNCKYNGENNTTEWVCDMVEEHNLCKVCPETLGKLQVPRTPIEITNNKAIDKDGNDQTQALELGSSIAYMRAVITAKNAGEEIEGAILKSNSPTCGCGKIYDGTFTNTLVDGNGIFAQYLIDKGIKVYTEEEKIDD